MKEFISLQFPAILGSDVAGVVDEIGPDVTDFTIGQEVYGMANAAGGHGSYAEYAPVSAKQLAAKPTTLDFITAAAVPLAGVSAYQALVDHLALQPGQKILIHGGAGGIGSLAIQIAKQLGAHVATTVKAADTSFVTNLGADEVIDYTAQDFTETLTEFDAVFDTVGGETNTKSYTILKPGGSLVSLVAPPNDDLVAKHNIHYTHQSSQPTVERLTELANLIDSGKLKVNVDKTFSLDQAPEALEYLKTGHPKGKVVIQVIA
jgi:NADPH:quinone reductase-like Zn-dependent oxidoreductase